MTPLAKTCLVKDVCLLFVSCHLVLLLRTASATVTGQTPQVIKAIRNRRTRRQEPPDTFPRLRGRPKRSRAPPGDHKKSPQDSRTLENDGIRGSTTQAEIYHCMHRPCFSVSGAAGHHFGCPGVSWGPFGALPGLRKCHFRLSKNRDFRILPDSPYFCKNK